MTHQTKPYRFAVLSHSKQVEDMLGSFAMDPSFSLSFHKIFYDASVLGMENLIEEKYDAILCYSTFASSIAEQFGKSIVIIQKTEADVIRTLTKAREYSSTVALSVHKNEYIDLQFFEKFLEMHIIKIDYHSRETLTEGIRKAINDGVPAIVGGGLSDAIAMQFNTRCFVVTPNMQSIKLAVDQAKTVARAQRDEKESRDQLFAMLKVFRDGIICFSRDKKVLFSNNKAATLLKTKKGSEERFEEYFNIFQLDKLIEDGVSSRETVISVHNTQLLLTALPIAINDSLQGVVLFISDVEDVHQMNRRIRESQRKTSGFTARYTLQDFRGEAPEVLRLKRMAELYAPHNAPICIQGETGTGKEVLAQSIHNASPRAEQPFVAINCAALPESLLESELFGYEEGAFTGAKRGGKPGVFELAHGGTLFLDEVGCMDAKTQPQLLRVLETQEIMRVGGNRVIPVDVRIICASHRLLSELVAEESFRKDLLYRLAVLRLHIPPLRQRVEDIPAIFAPLLHRYSRTEEEFTPRMMEALKSCSWPGNVRELLAFIESYVILLSNNSVDEVFFLELLADWTSNAAILAPAPLLPKTHGTADGDLKSQMNAIRKQIILDTVRHCDLNRQAAASRLGISYNTLWRIIGGAEKEEQAVDRLKN